MTDENMTDMNQIDAKTEHTGNDKNSPCVHSFYSYEIHGTDTDYMDQIHMHSLFSMMQEAASLNADIYGWGSEVLDSMDICWLLLRMSVRMTRRPAWQEKVTVETWSRGAEKIYFHREFIMYDGNKKKIGAGSSVWILANKTTHRPVRPSAVLEISKVSSDLTAAMLQDPPKISPKFDKEWMSANQTGENTMVKFADFSEIDRNHHVNNTRYVAWCMDAAHNKYLDQCEILGIDINYNTEIHFGEKVVLFFEQDAEKNVQVDGFAVSQEKIAFSAVLYKD